VATIAVLPRGTDLGEPVRVIEAQPLELPIPAELPEPTPRVEPAEEPEEVPA
jgi:hypothetical protein